MYELARISLHNWYLFEGIDLEIAGTTAVIGATGSGKSALLDAIQVVLSGNHRSAVRLNAAAGERNDRRVKGYCLGAVADVNNGAPLRKRAETTIALTFRDTDTGHEVAIGLLMDADEDEPVEDVRSRFVLEGHGFSIKDHITTDEDGEMHVVSHQTMVERLRQLGRKLTFHTVRRSYVGTYLAAMRPGAPPDPDRVLQTLRNALAIREFSDPTDFVRRFVLERHDVEITRARSSISVWRELEAESLRLATMEREIGAVRGRYQTWLGHYFDEVAHHYTAARAERRRRELDIARQQKLIANATTRIETADRVIARNEEITRDLQDEIISKRTLLSASAEGARALIVKTEIEAAEARRRTAESTLGAILRLYRGASDLGRITANLPVSLHKAVRDAAAFATLTASPESRIWRTSLGEAATLAQSIISLARAAEPVQAQIEAKLVERERLRRDLAPLAERMTAAGESGALLARQTVDFIALLKAQGIDARALPDVVEVSDPSWAMALEALLGPFREALIVPAAQVQQAFDLLYKRRNELYGCRLVNTRRLGEGVAKLPAQSIAAIAVTDDAEARAFIDRQVGRFVRVEAEAELHDHPHAILRNGKTTSGLGLQVHRDQTPILGKTARAQGIEEAREQHRLMTAELKALEGELALLQAALRLLQSLETAPAPEAFVRAAEDLDHAEGELARLQRARTAVESEDSLALRREIAELEAEIAARREEQRDEQAARNDALRQLSIAEREVEEHGRETARLQASEDEDARLMAAENVPLVLARLGRADLLEQAAGRIEHVVDFSTSDALKALAELRIAADRQWAETRRLQETTRRHLTRDLNAYCDTHLGAWPLPGESTEIQEFLWAEQEHRRLVDHVLRPHQERVRIARSAMEEAIKEDLLTKLSERFQSATRAIDTLNARLGRREFVGQRYSFRHTITPRLKPIYDLVRMVAQNPDKGLLAAAEAGVDAAISKAMAEIETLLSEEQDVAYFEDYRNYFEYDLYISNGRDAPAPISKTIGFLSGGQREAPGYVSIAASMVATYYPKGRAGDGEGMGLVLMDEAFAKLDIPNTQRIIDLYRALHLQILIAAPESKRGTFMEAVDTIINIDRVRATNHLHVDVEQIGPAARAAMAAANPEHRGVEAFRQASLPVEGLDPDRPLEPQEI